MTRKIEVREGVEYGRGGGRPLVCDVYAPEGLAALAPALMLVHGGGWRGGSREMMRPFATRIAAEGYVCVAPEYRLTPESPWPAQIHDVKAALRWLRANAATLGVDPERIALQGSSAGAHLVLLAAGTPDFRPFDGDGGNAGVAQHVKAVVGIYPPTLMFVGDERVHGGTPARALMGDAADEESARLASPVAHVTPSFPPAFLLHGTADKTVPVSASMVMYEALVRAGVPVEMHLYAEAPHGFARAPRFTDLVVSEILNFLQRYVIEDGAHASEPLPAGQTPARAD